MSKRIKMTPEIINDIRRDFETSLISAKMADGKFDFSKSFGSLNEKATVYFTELAWQKMQAIIREFDKEVAWHGVATRGSENKNEYFISDILVYPQEVTGTTVNTDQEKYQTWLYQFPDEIFNNIRMQGHSHVNMGVTPSCVDTTYWEKILDQMDDTMFYIFLIFNKRGEKYFKIYDMAKNILFENTDVTAEVIEDESGVQKFLKEAKTMVSNRVYTSPTTTQTYYQSKPATTAPTQTTEIKGGVSQPAATTDKDKNKTTPISSDTKNKRKGKRKDKPRQSSSSIYYAGLCGAYDDDYDYDPYR